MAKDNKKFHKRPKVSLDLQATEGLEAVKELSQKIEVYCTYDCYYCDCGIPCPEDSKCHLHLVELCNKLSKMMEFEEEQYIDYPPIETMN